MPPDSDDRVKVRDLMLWNSDDGSELRNKGDDSTL